MRLRHSPRRGDDGALAADDTVRLRRRDGDVGVKQAGSGWNRHIDARNYLEVMGRYPRVDHLRRFRGVPPHEAAVGGARGRPRPGRAVRRIELIAGDRVIDVTRYSRKARISGIPRVVKGLIDSDAARDYRLAVWDRGALCPVELDEAGRITFPRRYWRRPPREPLLQRCYLFLRRHRAGMLILAVTEAAGLSRALASLLLPILRGRVRRTRARVNLRLDEARLVIPEVPEREDVEPLLAYLEAGAEVDLRIFVHDLLPLSHPELFEDASVLSHVVLLRLLGHASRIVTSTQLLRTQIEQVLGGLGGNVPEIDVAELPVMTAGITASPTVGAGRISPRRGLLFVGGFEDRKGLERLLDAFDADRPDGLEVLVIGDPHPLRPAEAALFRRALSAPGIELLGHVSDERYLELLQQVEALLYLSYAEGYGLPILEGLAFGVPIVCADTPVNRYFSGRYGGITTIPVAGRGVSVDDLRAALLSRRWTEAPASDAVRASIPIAVEPWARRILSDEAEQ